MSEGTFTRLTAIISKPRTMLIIVLLVILLVVYPHFSPTPLSRLYRDPQGFLFFTSENLMSQNTSAYIIFQNLRCDKGLIDVDIYLECVYYKRAENGSAFFVLQVLHQIYDATVTMNGYSPELLGGGCQIVPYPAEDVSYLLIEVPRKNITSILSHFHIQFELNGAFWRKGYYSYNLIVSFNTGFPHFITDVMNDGGLPRVSFSLLYPYESPSFRISIARPELDTIVQMTPSPDNLGYSGNTVWYSWDIGKRSSSELVSTSVVIDVEHEGGKLEYNIRFPASWVVIAAIVALAIETLVKKLGPFTAQFRSKKGTPKYVV